MPRIIKIRSKSGEPIQVTMDNSFEKNTGITAEEVYDDTQGNEAITSITITGKIAGQSSPLVLEISSDDCDVDVEFG